jgi:hypothetical protein
MAVVVGRQVGGVMAFTDLGFQQISGPISIADPRAHRDALTIVPEMSQLWTVTLIHPESGWSIRRRWRAVKQGRGGERPAAGPVAAQPDIALYSPRQDALVKATPRPTLAAAALSMTFIRPIGGPVPGCSPRASIGTQASRSGQP